MKKKLLLLFIFIVRLIDCSPVSILGSFCKSNIYFSPILPAGLFFAWLDRKKTNREKKNIVEEMGIGFEEMFRAAGKWLPWYWYISKPAYKATGGRDNPLVSVPASFVTTDLIMHRVLPNGVNVLIVGTCRSRFKLDPWTYLKKELIFYPGSNYRSFGWFLISLPLAWHKYIKLKDSNDRKY